MNSPSEVLRVLCGLAVAAVTAVPFVSGCSGDSGDSGDAGGSGGPVRVAGGTPAGEYITFARATCKALGSLFACHPVETAGSQENVDRLKLSPTDPRAVDMAFLQGDVAERFQEEPGFHDRFVVVRSIVGEAVLLVMAPETAAAVRNWAGVKDAADLLSIGLPGERSGDTATFTALAAHGDRRLEGLQVTQYPGREQLIDAVRSGQGRIAWLVQYPNTDNPVFKQVTAAGLVVMGVVDPDLAKSGGPFGVQDVTVAHRCLLWVCWSANPIHTTTIKAAIVARASSTYADRHAQGIASAAIHRIQQARETDLLPKQSWVRELIDAATITARAGVDSLYDQMTGEAVGARERVDRLDQ